MSSAAQALNELITGLDEDRSKSEHLQLLAERLGGIVDTPGATVAVAAGGDGPEPLVVSTDGVRAGAGGIDLRSLLAGVTAGVRHASGDGWTAAAVSCGGPSVAASVCASLDERGKQLLGLAALALAQRLARLADRDVAGRRARIIEAFHEIALASSLYFVSVVARYACSLPKRSRSE